MTDRYAFSYQFISPLPGRWNSLEHYLLRGFLYLMNDFTGQRPSSVNKEQNFNKKDETLCAVKGEKKEMNMTASKINLQIDSVWNGRT